MKILWYPKNIQRLRNDRPYIFVGTNRMRVYDFHECIKLRSGIISEIAEYTIHNPDPFNFDVVIFAKQADRDLGRHLRESGILTIWDICDPTLLKPKTGTSFDLLVVNNRELKEYFLRQMSTLKIDVIDDQHECDLSVKKVHAKKDKILVTWYGVRANYDAFVYPLIPMLKRLDFVDFKWAGGEYLDNKATWGFTEGIEMGMDWREAWFTPNSWLSFIKNSDVGIVPVTNQIKPQHKILNYMAYGIPVICSPTDAYCQIIRHGENGFIARTEEDWCHYLNLLREPDLRNRIGQQAKKDIGELRQVEAVAERYLDLIKEHLRIKKDSEEASFTKIFCKARLEAKRWLKKFYN